MKPAPDEMDRAIAKRLDRFRVLDQCIPGIGGFLAAPSPAIHYKQDSYPRYSISFDECSEMERHFTESEWREYIGFINSNSKYPDLTTAIRRASPLELCEAACRVWFKEMFE